MEKATSRPLTELLTVLRSNTPYVKNKWLNAVRKFTSAYSSTETPKVGTAPPTTYIPTTQSEAIDATTNYCKLNPQLPTVHTEKVLEGEHSPVSEEIPSLKVISIESTPNSIERDNTLTTENCSESKVWTKPIRLDDGQPKIKQLEFDIFGFVIHPEPIYRMRHKTFAWEPGSKRSHEWTAI